MHRARDRCRLCNSAEVELVVPMRPTPIADAYVAAEEAGHPQPSYPLDLYLCRSCGHVQLLDIVDPEVLFGRYIYFTANSLGLREHFRDYAARISERFPIPERSLVIDIGSNDGTLLRFFQERGMRVVGVDAAREIARQATANGIETLPAFFSRSVAASVRQRYGQATVVTANNVFAHADDLAGILLGIRELLSDDGVFVFEASYLADIVDNLLFDTVYHEHLCYHSVKPLSLFFRRHGMELFDVQRIASKGGSLRGFVQHRGGPHAFTAAVGKLIALEDDVGLGECEIFQRFANRIESSRQELRGLLGGFRAAGKSIAGFGASATVTTLIYQLELGESLDFIVDDNPQRHGLFSPGYHIPVVSPQVMYERKPDYVVILAWNYAEPIMKRHAPYRDQGGRFILPMPAPRVA